MPLWLQLTLPVLGLLVGAVLLRLYAGDDPRNQDDDTTDGDQDDGGPDLLIAA